MEGKKFLAKSDGETIIQHTKLLLKNLDILKEIYPDINVNWALLKLACIYHDLGKLNEKFQYKVDKNLRTTAGEVPHGLLSTAFIPAKELIHKGFSKEEVEILAYAIGRHHERDFSKVSIADIKREVSTLDVTDFPYQQLGIDELHIRVLSKKYFEHDVHMSVIQFGDAYFDYVMLKGLLNRLDYAASGHIEVEHPNDFLIDSMGNLGYQWNDLQEYMLTHQKENLVITAQTGLGKTEAGLLWLGNNKGFFTLPIKAAINAIYNRIVTKVVKDTQEQKIGLLHSSIHQEYLRAKDEGIFEELLDVDNYVNRTRQLSLPLTVCTLDQLFDIVFRYPGYEQKIATLSYSKVIIDEIQMYSADLLAYLIYGLKMITDYGGSFAVLTATLPPYITDLMMKEGLRFKQPKEGFVDENLMIRHSVEILHETMNTSKIIRVFSKNKILVICNTIKQAKQMYQQISDEVGTECVHLMHSAFIRRDRTQKEKDILDFAQNGNTDAGIWISTQIVEASLDIDFDILFTELSDLSGLFQRMGRCYRKRPWIPEIGINVYVYDGGSKNCSGIGTVIDKEIYELSKNSLLQVSGPLTESEKIKLISQMFTTDKVKTSTFYQSINDHLEFLELLFEGEKTKNEVLNEFRNIHNLSVIPSSIYEENKKIITKLVQLLKIPSKIATSQEKIEKKKGRILLNEYKVDLPMYALKGLEIEELEINDYEKISILISCNYDSNNGIELHKRQKKADIDVEDQFF